MSRNADALIAVLIEAAQRYVDHQEDDLGKPVLKREFFWGITGHFIQSLAAMAASEADPAAVVDSVLTQVRARSLRLIARLQEGSRADDEEGDDA